MPLLTTKLYIPAKHPNPVPRQRLMARLDEALNQPRGVILISARAGSGKTTLVSEWLHRQERPAVWLSLDANDNDPRRFMGYLLEALKKLGINIDHSLFNQFDGSHAPAPEIVVAQLINAIAGVLPPFIFTLEDYHFIQNTWIHQAIEFLIENQPEQAHIVINTRVDPPLPLARLRGRGRVVEIRDHDLRFTETEAAHFLNIMVKPTLSAEARTIILQRTEGWIAGIQMAAISMQARHSENDISTFIKAFSGANRFILDYLMEEVLSQQTPLIQDFLIETSILESMCAQLCDAVRSTRIYKEGLQPASQAILEQLERSNLFVISLDNERHWYRYHHLFADLLKSTLKQHMSNQEIRLLHRRAGQWHQSQNLLEGAMTHTLAAQDFTQAAAMIDENIADMLARSEAPVLMSWIDKLPQNLVRGLPWIDIYRANTIALTGRLEEVEPLLTDVEKRVEPDSPRASELLGHIAAVRSYCANLRGDAAGALEIAALTKSYLPEQHLAARGMAVYALADTYLAQDDLHHAGQALLDLLKAGEQTGQIMLSVTALCELATVKKAFGRLYQAQEHYNHAWQWMVEKNGLDSRVRCAYEFGLADLLREWNRLEAAHQHAITANQYRLRLGGYLVSGDIVMMRILQSLGDTEGAMGALYNAEHIIETHFFQMATTFEFRAARVVQWLAVGDVKMAANLAKDFSGSELENIALARLLLAQERPAEAQNLLESQRLLALAGGRAGRQIEILGLLAIALEAQGLTRKADTALTEAISLARSNGHMRVFLDLGGSIFHLYERLSGQNLVSQTPVTKSDRVLGEYDRALLDAFRHEAKLQRTRAMETDSNSRSLEAGFPDPLTQREKAVLQLLAEGLSNKEIAAKMVVAPSTIKQHLKNIYMKLEVHSRVQAVARGRDLDLL